MKIIIVDDEVLVRVGIRSMLTWEDYECEIAGEASNGAEALELVEKVSPDMMLLDLTMPGMDGIEVIKRVRKTDLDMVIVVVSCHEDFQLVREALCSGANDYLLKHSLYKEDFIRIINENRYMIKKRKNTFDSAEKFSFQVAMDRFFSGKSDSGIKTVLGECYETLYMIVFTVEKYEKVQERYKNKNENFFRDTVVDITDKILFYLTNKKIWACGENRFCAFVGCNSTSPEALSSAAPSEVTSKLVQSARKYLNIGLLLGVSMINTGNERFFHCLKQADGALQMSFFGGDDHVFLWKECDLLKLRREASTLTEHMAGELKVAIKGNDKNKFEQVLEEYKVYSYKLRQIGGIYYKKLLQLIIGDLFTLTLSELQSLADDIENAQDIFAVMQVLREGYDFNKNSSIPKYETENYLVRQTIQYILDNYFKDVTLETIAEYLHVSEGYISRLFKAETKTNIFKFLNTIRIEQAKKILRDHTLKPYQVADLVGFNNRVYFDNVFKAIEGVTPSEYRKKYIQ